MKESYFSAKRITGIAVLLAFVILFQAIGGFLKIGTTSLSLVLVPIVLGGLLFGVRAGAFLGFSFGLITLIYGIAGWDAFTMILFTEHPIITTVLCLGKGTAAGACAAAVFKLLKGKNEWVGTLIAAATAPVVNTGLFVLGALFMSDTLSANFVADGMSVFYFLVIVCAGVNFLVELAINLVCSPAIYRVARVISRTEKR